MPFWIDAEDICIDIYRNALHVSVRNELELRRTCWQNRWASITVCFRSSVLEQP